MAVIALPTRLLRHEIGGVKLAAQATPAQDLPFHRNLLVASCGSFALLYAVTEEQTPHSNVTSK
jgi:hypothetical protein